MKTTKCLICKYSKQRDIIVCLKCLAKESLSQPENNKSKNSLKLVN